MKGYHTTIGFLKKLAEAKKEIDCPFVVHLRNLGGVVSLVIELFN